jgi:hypothetical protein
MLFFIYRPEAWFYRYTAKGMAMPYELPDMVFI